MLVEVRNIVLVLVESLMEKKESATEREKGGQ